MKNILLSKLNSPNAWGTGWIGRIPTIPCLMKTITQSGHFWKNFLIFPNQVVTTCDFTKYHQISRIFGNLSIRIVCKMCAELIRRQKVVSGQHLNFSLWAKNIIIKILICSMLKDSSNSYLAFPYVNNLFFIQKKIY